MANLFILTSELPVESPGPMRGLSQDSFFTVRILGTFLSLVAYFLDESANLDYKTILLTFHGFLLEIARQWGSIAD